MSAPRTPEELAAEAAAARETRESRRLTLQGQIDRLRLDIAVPRMTVDRRSARRAMVHRTYRYPKRPSPALREELAALEAELAAT